MNLIELKDIIKSAKNKRSELPENSMFYFFKVYTPISDAIAANDKAVIEYLINCESDDRLCIFSAIESGAERLNIFKSYKLRSVIKKDKKRLEITNKVDYLDYMYRIAEA